MQFDLIEMKTKIMKHYYNENYEECIKLCKILLQEIKQDDEEYTYYMWFATTTLAISYKCTEDHNKAITNAKLSLEYVGEPNHYARSIWVIARCYEKTDVKNAIKYYDECIEYYSNYDKRMMLATIFNNKGELLQDEQLINKAIEIYKEELKKDNSEEDTDYLYRAIDDTYRILALIYISKNMTTQAYKTIKLIDNKEIKQMLKQKIQLG